MSTTPDNTPTARTDAIAHMGLERDAYIAGMTDLARQLEREFIASQQELREARADNGRLDNALVAISRSEDELREKPSEPVAVSSGRMVGRGRVMHEGRWVTKCWYRRHVINPSPNPRRNKRERDQFSSDNIEWVRGIMDVIDTITNPNFRATVCAMLTELHRLKSTPPNVADQRRSPE